jgi:S1-C subfamily serine protease
MEELTKQQLVLLTLLVSFVSSIATSVSVVALLNESPMTITQTVNRIVERTIEKVVPEQILPAPAPEPAAPPLSPAPIVRDGELVVKAVEMNLPAVVTLWSWKTEKEESAELGLAFSVSPDGLVVTDKNILGEAAEYSAIFPNGKIYKAKRAYADKDSNIAVLVLRDDKDQNATGTPSVSFSPDEPKLGASVVALGGKEGATVYQGIVSEKIKSRIITSISFKPVDRGGILFGMDGKVFGINVADGEEKYTLSSAVILSALETYRKEVAPKTP